MKRPLGWVDINSVVHFIIQAQNKIFNNVTQLSVRTIFSFWLQAIFEIILCFLGFVLWIENKSSFFLVSSKTGNPVTTATSTRTILTTPDCYLVDRSTNTCGHSIEDILSKMKPCYDQKLLKVF